MYMFVQIYNCSLYYKTLWHLWGLCTAQVHNLTRCIFQVNCSHLHRRSQEQTNKKTGIAKIIVSFWLNHKVLRCIIIIWQISVVIVKTLAPSFQSQLQFWIILKDAPQRLWTTHLLLISSYDIWPGKKYATSHKVSKKKQKSALSIHSKSGCESVIG